MTVIYVAQSKSVVGIGTVTVIRAYFRYWGCYREYWGYYYY